MNVKIYIYKYNFREENSADEPTGGTGFAIHKMVPYLAVLWPLRGFRTEDRCSNEKVSLPFNPHHHSDTSLRACSYGPYFSV